MLHLRHFLLIKSPEKRQKSPIIHSNLAKEIKMAKRHDKFYQCRLVFWQEKRFVECYFLPENYRIMFVTLRLCIVSYEHKTRRKVRKTERIQWRQIVKLSEIFDNLMNCQVVTKSGSQISTAFVVFLNLFIVFLDKNV